MPLPIHLDNQVQPWIDTPPRPIARRLTLRRQRVIFFPSDRSNPRLIDKIGSSFYRYPRLIRAMIVLCLALTSWVVVMAMTIALLSVV